MATIFADFEELLFISINIVAATGLLNRFGQQLPVAQVRITFAAPLYGIVKVV